MTKPLTGGWVAVAERLRSRTALSAPWDIAEKTMPNLQPMFPLVDEKF